MRKHLTKKQTKILDQIFTETRGVTWEDIPVEQQDAISQISDYENLWSDAERYLMDKFCQSPPPKGGAQISSIKINESLPRNFSSKMEDNHAKL